MSDAQLEDPDYLAASAVRYVARPIVCLPTPSGGFMVFEGYTSRRFLRHVHADDLAVFLQSLWEESDAEYTATREREQRKRELSAPPEFDLNDLGL